MRSLHHPALRLKREFRLFCAWVLLLTGAVVSAAESPVPLKRTTRTVSGWTLHIDDRLTAAQPQATEVAVALLQQQLGEILSVVPALAVTELRKVPLYFSPEYPGLQPRAEYHPDGAWLREHGRDPVMARAVEFTNIGIFEREMSRMPNFALHELAHAYHHRVLRLSFGNPEILAAHARAKAGGTYDLVARRFGNGRPETRERAYALTTPQEFFAETTEAFFSHNDYFPFTLEDLQRHDPETRALLEILWGTK